VRFFMLKRTTDLRPVRFRAAVQNSLQIGGKRLNGIFHSYFRSIRSYAIVCFRAIP